ncbi:Polygalacturonase inhibitor [Carex littledalei]|uniref:Polygalacturonase inhibitor n=1 Tax=Carex littledalei TaxID=544730 RepID=A0A833QEM5_9POAL|nr:Polygalacturonase inhibitor [Carex littledalei]
MASTKYQYFSFLFLLLTVPILASATTCDKADKSALFAIKSELNNPPGLSSWSSNTLCCTWNEIHCDSTTGRVTALTIFGLNVSVPIPPSIAKLTALQTLNLPYDQLYGPIPPFLSLLPELTFLRLDGNMLTGSIPPTLTLLLDPLLVGNRLTGHFLPPLQKQILLLGI